MFSLPGGSGLEELWGDGVLVDGVVAGDDGDAARGDEVVFGGLLGVIADDGAVGEVDVAIDDGLADAAVAADVDVAEKMMLESTSA